MLKIILRIAASLSLLISGTVSANECLAQLPTGTVPVGNIKICQSGITGLSAQYSCQDYRHGKQHFRLIYKGGIEPKAIVRLDARAGEQLIWPTTSADPHMRCPLPAPNTIPKHASHLGLGICQDENDASIPCSVYEHAPVRQPQTFRYLVFFHPDDKGSELVHQMPIRDNPNAMVAELAYQLGLSLLETSCCSEQASAYLAHAHRLFPMASAYRAGYLDALEQLAVNAGEGADF